MPSVLQDIMDQIAPLFAQNTVHPTHAHRQMAYVRGAVRMVTMDLIAPSIAQNTVHLVTVQKQLEPVLKGVLMVTTETSVIKHVPATVTSNDVTNRVESVLFVPLGFMAVTVSSSVDTVLMDLATEQMEHAVHAQLDIMVVNVVIRVLTVKLLPVIKIVVSVHRDV